MGEAAAFEGRAVFPFGAIGAAKEGWIFENGAGVGVDDGEGVVGDDGVVGVVNGASVVEGVGLVGVVNNQLWGRRSIGGGDDAVCSWAREVAGFGAGEWGLVPRKVGVGGGGLLGLAPARVARSLAALRAWRRL